MIWWFAASAVIGAVVAYAVNQFPPLPDMARRRRAAVSAVIIAVCLATGTLVQWWVDTLSHAVTIDLASPDSGDRVPRPFTPVIALGGSVEAGHSLWLAYRNQSGGPYTVQALRCTLVGKRLDCGPVYLGSGPSDASTFKLVVIEANQGATTALSDAAKGVVQEPGRNFSAPDLPDGAHVIGQLTNLQLAR